MFNNYAQAFVAISVSVVFSFLTHDLFLYGHSLIFSLKPTIDFFSLKLSCHLILYNLIDIKTEYVFHVFS